MYRKRNRVIDTFARKLLRFDYHRVANSRPGYYCKNTFLKKVSLNKHQISPSKAVVVLLNKTIHNFTEFQVICQCFNFQDTFFPIVIYKKKHQEHCILQVRTPDLVKSNLRCPKSRYIGICKQRYIQYTPQVITLRLAVLCRVQTGLLLLCMAFHGSLGRL